MLYQFNSPEYDLYDDSLALCSVSLDIDIEPTTMESIDKRIKFSCLFLMLCISREDTRSNLDFRVKIY